uniref:Kazal-like domain-containing protein n=1 Tax=Timema bartmani TaxID=61472 RepID=A0A7R9EXL9_9NEOP|nr:unnamed protein product [Timema bartmani]
MLRVFLFDAAGSTVGVCVSEKARPGVVCGGEQRWERRRPVQPSSTDNAPGSSQGGLPKIKLPERYMDEPEALCVCKETQVACGSNNKTYDSVCQMNQEAADSGFPNTLYLKHWGPCRSVGLAAFRTPCISSTGDLAAQTISRATYTPASGNDEPNSEPYGELRGETLTGDGGIWFTVFFR